MATRTRKTTGRPGARKTGARKTGARAAGKPTARRSTTRRPQDVIALLKSDHKAVKELFRKVQAQKGKQTKTKQTLVQKIVQELTVHTELEEKLVYPAISQEVQGTGRKIDEAYTEHAEAKQLLEQIDAASVDDPSLDQLLAQLIADVKHHVREEEGELLPKMRKSIDRDTLREMGREAQRLKKQLTGRR